MAWSYFNDDNFIRNLVTITCDGASQSLEVRRIATSPALPVDLDEVLHDLRVDDPEDAAERASVERMYRTACIMVEKASGCVCLRGTFEILMGGWPSQLEVRRFPVREVLGLAGMTGPGTWSVSDPAQLYVEPTPDSFRVMTLSTFAKPDLWTEVSRTRLQFDAGWDDAAGTGVDSADPLFPIQEPYRGILTAMTAHLYKNRELLEADKMGLLEQGLGSLLGAVRTFW